MLKNWKEKIPCERCDSLQKELKELKETLNDKEKSISSMKEIDELNLLLHLDCEPSPKMLPAGHFCCITYPYVDILYYFFLTVPASAQSVRFLRALTDFYDHNSCSPSVNIPLTISSSHGDEHQETQMKGLLPSFVSCSSCTVLLLRCLLLIFEGRPIFGDYHSCLQKAFCQSISSFKSALECMMTVIFYCGERHYHVSLC